MSTRPLAPAMLSAVLLATGPSLAHAQDVRQDVEALTTEAMAGRRAGTEGEQLAAAYIADELDRLGARPLPGRMSLLSPFNFTAGSLDAGSSVTVEYGGEARTFDGAVWVQALAFSDDAVVSGEVVFAGYGLVVPAAQTIPYDSYAGLDVTDKIVVVLRYSPEDADPDTRVELARYSGLRYKALAARERGARALLVVTGPRSPNAGNTVPMGYDSALAGSGIPAASVSGEVADALFAGADTPLEALQEVLDRADPHTTGVELAGVTVTLRTAVERERATARNVLAYLPATAEPLPDKPWVAIGAHYDHLGKGAHGSSLASREDAGGIHYGADDNASGTAAVLEIARTLAVQPRERHLLIAFWSAEESGLLGSNAFVTEGPVPPGQIAAYLNFDMVGRMQDNQLIVQATGTSPDWPAMLEQVNVLAGFDLRTQADPYQPTDVATFNGASVPSLSFTTGAHVDYHKPSDTAEKVAYADLDRIAGMAARLVQLTMRLTEAPEFVRVEPTVQRGSPGGVRLTTGTIPDYATEAEGMLLSGVIGGGPAEGAGLQRGDLIVEIAGQTITNIYDYTFALALLRVDEPITVVYIRNGERRETTLTPVPRP